MPNEPPPTSSPPWSVPHRYVVLHHTGISEPHFDLLIDWREDALLLAARCTSWPIDDATVVTRIPDHRRIYLEYEGPISGNRGQVRRVTEGTCTLEVDDEGSTLVRLDTGRSLRLPRAAWE